MWTYLVFGAIVGITYASFYVLEKSGAVRSNWFANIFATIFIFSAWALDLI